MKRDIAVEHNGQQYTGVPMVIERTHLGYESHGIFSAYLSCSNSGSGVQIGGFALDRPNKEEKFGRRVGTAFGLDHIIEILAVLGVESWEEVRGQEVIVLFAGGPFGRAVGFAHSREDRIMIFEEHAAKFREEKVPA